MGNEYDKPDYDHVFDGAHLAKPGWGSVAGPVAGVRHEMFQGGDAVLHHGGQTVLDVLGFIPGVNVLTEGAQALYHAGHAASDYADGNTEGARTEGIEAGWHTVLGALNLFTGEGGNELKGAREAAHAKNAVEGVNEAEKAVDAINLGEQAVSGVDDVEKATNVIRVEKGAAEGSNVARASERTADSAVAKSYAEVKPVDALDATAETASIAADNVVKGVAKYPSMGGRAATHWGEHLLEGMQSNPWIAKRLINNPAVEVAHKFVDSAELTWDAVSTVAGAVSGNPHAVPFLGGVAGDWILGGEEGKSSHEE